VAYLEFEVKRKGGKKGTFPKTPPCRKSAEKGDSPLYQKGGQPPFPCPLFLVSRFMKGHTLGNAPFYSRINKTRNFFLPILVYEGVVSANRKDYRGMLRRQRRSLENAS